MKGIAVWLQNYINVDSLLIGYYLSIALKIVVIIIISRIIISIANRLIVKAFRLHPKLRADEKKSNTLIGILRSIVKYAVYIIMGISILNVLNIPTEPLLATAGLGGLAIGFGAQSLVRDIFTGFFILFEDQYGVGDYITTGSMTGTVEDMGLRTTKVRASNGDLHIIPNGEVKTVTNHSRGNSLATIDVGIAYEADAEKAMDVLKEITKEYYSRNSEKIAQEPEVLGIIKFNESEVVIRTIIQAKPLLHWQVEREVRLLVLEAFKKQNIEIPYPKRVVINQKDA
ncbi:MAG: mechanosensitive ion channel family protein [Caulobacteraceae bacterium]